MIYTTQGMRGPLVAVPLVGSGKRSDSDVVWRFEQGTPDTPCPVLQGDLLFTANDDGIGRCFDAANGKIHWKERLKGDYKASPISADGKIFFLNTTGLCTVIAASGRFERLAENELPDTTIASPAVSGGHIFIRGRKALYCIGEKF